MAAEQAPCPIMTRLKESTQALHDATENGEFNRQLVQGRLPLESYIESLGQLFLIHRSLERELRRHQAAMAPIGAVVRDYQFQEPYLRNDLAYFGRNPDDVGPLTATRNFIGQVQRTSARQPIALLGMHYVLEGSNNGSKFISRAVRRAYGLSELNGTHYLDPYGDRQKEYWESFKADMNQQVFSESDTAAILDAAAKTFEAVMELHLELYRLVTPDSVGS